MHSNMERIRLKKMVYKSEVERRIGVIPGLVGKKGRGGKESLKC